MKERRLISEGDPCTTRLDDPGIQSMSDAQKQGPTPCRYYETREDCSPPKSGCVQLSGQKVARYVLEYYAEATEETLAAEVEEFRKRAPLPPDAVEAYLDTPDQDHKRLTDPDLIVKKVAEYARKVLDLKAGEKPLRSGEDLPPLDPDKDPGGRATP